MIFSWWLVVEFFLCVRLLGDEMKGGLVHFFISRKIQSEEYTVFFCLNHLAISYL